MIDNLKTEYSDRFAVWGLVDEYIEAWVPNRRICAKRIDVVESLLLQVLRRRWRICYLNGGDQLGVERISQRS